MAKRFEFKIGDFDASNPLSIYEYSRHLIGHSLHSLFGDDVFTHARKGKGKIGQMVEDLYFGYSPNSNQEADFFDAKLELKCTPLKHIKKEITIKERLSCTMIDYHAIATVPFEESDFMKKCHLMLLLFYLHIQGGEYYDFEFLFRVLWQIPEKDLEIFRQDYETIASKVRAGLAHELSEGDTLYLGAFRKGQKGDVPQIQPYSDIRAKRRAFSIKTSYMRHLLEIVKKNGKDHYCNYIAPPKTGFELVTAEELRQRKFEDLICQRFDAFIGMNYEQICHEFDIPPYASKSKYADIAGLIASKGECFRLKDSDEFIKSGIIMKTVRLKPSGIPKESMSFKNIDYQEVLDNDEWEDSEAYEVFTNRFMFVVFRPQAGKISVINKRTGECTTEDSYVLDSVFFWTMPPDDLALAEKYWSDIRENVINDNIDRKAFWSLADRRKFHVRPKATNSDDLADNPHGGKCPKLCYWMNADYVGEIIKTNKRNGR